MRRVISIPLPPAPTEEASTEPTDEAPTEPTEQAPKPTEQAPAEPTAEAPTDPTAEAPTDPTAEAPTDPTEEAPTDPTEEAPTDPTEEAPTDPTEEAPTEPTQEASTESEVPLAPPPPPFRSEALVVAQVVSPKLGETEVYEEPIDPSWIGKRVEYALVYVNGKGRESALTEVVHIDPVAALAPPGPPTAEAADGFVALSWSPPSQAPASIGFSVYRRLEEAQDYPEAPLNPEPLSTPSFEDQTAVFGAASCYVVATVLAPRGSIASDPSEEVCVTPEDRFAPPAPTGLVAVPSSDAILLSWRDVDAPDRKGYRVYRGASPEGPFELVAEVTDSSYADGSAASDGTYFYTVTAIDDAPGTNESPRSEVAEARRSP